MRKVFLDDLPRWQKGEGLCRPGAINWKKCIGYKVPFIYDDVEGELEILDYGKTVLTIEYKGDEFLIYTDAILRCSLGKVVGRYTNEFKMQIGQTFKDDKRDLIVIDRNIIIDKNGIKRKKYKYKCLKCGFSCGEHYKKGKYVKELWVNESFLLSKKGGCTCCRQYPQIVVEGINDIPTTTPWMVKYFQGGYDEAKRYTFISNQEIYPVCPDCKNTKDKPIKIDKIYGYQGINCECGDNFSFGHKYIFSMLKQLGINFQDNVRLDWCRYEMQNKIKQGEYDFVIEGNKLILEVDGYFHRQDNSMSGQTKEESQFIDKEKDRLARENGYEVIRIMYDHKNRELLNETILSSNIKKYFNLQNINWKQCFEYALSNISKSVADYWNNKEEWETTTDLMKHFGLCRKTILAYLKMWSNLGYCDYDSKIESDKRYEKMKELNAERRSKP